MNFLSKEIAIEFFEYDPISGSLKFKERNAKWFKSERACRAWNSALAGKEVGCYDGKGYKRTQILGKKTFVHRICWIILNGWTESEIDHINGVRDDNRAINLRLADRGINRMNQGIPRNNKSGFLGVSWAKHNKKWLASISIKGKKINLGYFDLKSDAIKAREAANIKYGYHNNHGKRNSHTLEIMSYG